MINGAKGVNGLSSRTREETRREDNRGGTMTCQIIWVEDRIDGNK